MVRGPHRPCDILLQQVESSGKEHDVFHEKRNVTGHCRKAPSNLVPSVWHQWNDGNGRNVCSARSESPKDSRLPIPKPPEQKYAKQPFHNTPKPATAANAERRISPPMQGSVADIGHQHLRLVRKPFLIPEQQEYDHH